MAQRAPASSQTIDIVFDLDWTLIKQLKRGEKLTGDNILYYQDEVYRLNDGALELLEYLNSKKNIRVSFFSGGGKFRNEAVLKKMKVGKGSAFDMAHKILSKDDLEVRSQDTSLTFTDRYKKNLLKVNSDLSNVLIIDDDIRFAANADQERNFLFLENVKYHFESPSDIHFGGGQFDPKTKAEWFFDKNKIYIVSDILENSLDEEDFLGAVKENRSKWDFKNNRFSPSQAKIFARKFPSTDCHDIMFKFLIGP
jgi:hypothetical protein